MLMNCKPGCSGKKVTTNASLNVNSDEVICDFCGISMEVSSFVKNSMKQRGDIVRTDERRDLSYSWQVYYELNIGAVRLEEARVVKVDVIP